MDLEEIKTKIKSSAILSDSEKSEWLFLLPKMTEGQKDELLRILEVRLPPPHPSGHPKNSEGILGATPTSSPTRGEELKERGKTEQTTPPSIPPLVSPDGTVGVRGGRGGAVTLSPFEGRAGEGLASHSAFNIPPYGGSLVGRQNSELTVEAMRQAPSPYEFFDNLAARMAVEAKTGKKPRQEITADFQASPLYKEYIKAGMRMLESTPTSSPLDLGGEGGGLTRSEFEAVAEFRTSLKKILSS